MASLTETAYYTRRTINWMILVFVGFILLRLFWQIFINVWLLIFPPKLPDPTHAFGKLPALKFPPQATPSGQLIFKLETIQGSVPRASESAVVYFMPKSAANLLALTHTQEFARRLGFDSAAIQETKNIYRFNDTAFPMRELRYDIVSNNFILRYDYSADTTVFNKKDLPLAIQVQAQAKALLQTYNLYQADLAGGPVKITYLNLAGNKLLATASLSRADAVRADFSRKQVNGMPFFTPNPDETGISIIFSGQENERKKIIQFAYTYWPIDYQSYATYAISQSSLAWQELQSGNGYIARYPQSGSTAVIRNVYLAYYDSIEPQLYLQPIFVFEGDDGFLAYVPAISREWTE